MTFDDDFCQLELQGGTRRFRCKAMGIAWPPPVLLEWSGFTFDQISCSEITDEQRTTMTHVCRGALYKPVEEDNAA